MPDDKTKFRIFKRRWWNKGPGGVLVPHVSRGTTITYIRGEAAAQAYCQAYNAVNLPKHNPLAIRAEYEGA